MADSGKRSRGRPRAFDRDAALVTALDVFWAKGYTQTTVADLCSAIGINPPSLYAAFGNKATLFLEAVRHYESSHWREPAERLMANPDVREAIGNFFQEAATLLISPDAPCGCMTVVTALNISESETEVIDELKKMRNATTEMFTQRLRIALQQRQIPLDTNVPVLALAFTAFLEGMSLQAREGIYLADLMGIGNLAVRLLPTNTKGTTKSSRDALI